MNNTSINNKHELNKTRLVEIIGPAGAGKTTLFNMLKEYKDKFFLSNFPNVRSILNFPFFLYFGLQLIPILFRLNKATKLQLSRQEFVWMTILYGWPIAIRKDINRRSQVIVLEQGPVYLMAELMEFGPSILRAEGSELFWQVLYRRWALTLNRIVWLDTTDINLLERIRTRDKAHILKNESDSNAYDLLARYRKAFDYIISKLESNSSELQILRFDTSKLQPDEIVDCLFSELRFS